MKAPEKLEPGIETQTANMGELVRCKYCKHHGEAAQSGLVYCPTFSGGFVSEDCFCTRWEKNGRTDNAEIH